MMRLRTLLLTTTALMPFFGVPAFAGPEGAVVIGGQVSVQNPGTANVTVPQSGPPPYHRGVSLDSRCQVVE